MDEDNVVSSEEGKGRLCCVKWGEAEEDYVVSSVRWGEEEGDYVVSSVKKL